MIEKSPDITEIAKALLAFQAQAHGVVKDSKNPHFKNRYASLEAVVDEARPVLQSVGISWMQAPGKINAGNIGMTTLLMHADSGQWISSDMEIPLGKQDPQGAGSAITYAQRYALMASLGLPPVDDDAEGAFDRNPQSAPMVGRNAPAAVRTSAAGATLSKLGETYRSVMLLAKTKDDLGAWMTDKADELKQKLGEEEASAIRTLAAARYRELPDAQQEAAE